MANEYMCFYKGTPVRIVADTSYEAQMKAAERLKVKRKTYEITVVLVKKNGVDVSHSTVEF